MSIGKYYLPYQEQGREHWPMKSYGYTMKKREWE
jgi:hypothetical protein